MRVMRLTNLLSLTYISVNYNGQEIGSNGVFIKRPNAQTTVSSFGRTSVNYFQNYYWSTLPINIYPTDYIRPFSLPTLLIAVCKYFTHCNFFIF